MTKEKITATARDEALARIECIDSVADMAPCGLVIEAATEREEIKRAIFAEVGKVLGADTVLASNTSSIPITRLAQASPDPARFVGVHFFNPVPVMGSDRADSRPRHVGCDGRRRSRTTRKALGKKVVRANDAPGFIVNRVLMPMINEACFAHWAKAWRRSRISTWPANWASTTRWGR